MITALVVIAAINSVLAYVLIRRIDKQIKELQEWRKVHLNYHNVKLAEFFESWRR